MIRGLMSKINIEYFKVLLNVKLNLNCKMFIVMYNVELLLNYFSVYVYKYMCWKGGRFVIEEKERMKDWYVFI